MVRASTLFFLTTGIWILNFELGVLMWGFQAIPAAFGIVLGLLFGVGTAFRTLRIIEEKGEYRVSGIVLLARLTVGTVIIVFAFLLLTALLGDSVLRIIGQGTYSAGPAVFAAQGVLFLSWETKNNKQIVSDGLVSSRFYVVPRNSPGRIVANYCTSCGGALVRDSMFCSSCGVRLQ